MTETDKEMDRQEVRQTNKKETGRTIRQKKKKKKAGIDNGPCTKESGSPLSLLPVLYLGN